MYCFAYVDYIDASNPNVPMKTSCCRELDPDVGGGLSTYRGTFVLGAHSERSEHNYAD
jgi:hypothetical protein